MESRKEETKTLPVFEENKTDTTQEDDDLKKIKDLQTLFDKLSKNEQLMLKLNALKETKNFAQIKSIDLIKFLRGTQYSTRVEQFFEFELVFKILEQGFVKLQCSHPDCEFQAVMAFEGKDGESTIQYCHYHFNHSNFSTESPRNFEFELRLHKILFDELEEQLVYIQDRIDYIKSDKNQKNMKSYAKIEEEVQRNLDNITSILKTMTERIYQLDETYKTKTNNKASMINFGDFLFVRKDLTECRESILTILSLISGPSSKNQAASLIQAMTDFKKEINLEEERKDISDSSVPHEIYNSDYQMVNFPSQSLQSIKNFEEKISTVYEYIETCQKNASELAESFSPFKHVLQEQLDQLLQKNYEECMRQLSLRDQQFYIDNLKLEGDRAKYFKDCFPTTSDVYKRLGQFDYGQPNCTTDHIKTYIHKYKYIFSDSSDSDSDEEYNNDRIYIGEVKEGTDDTPHGIGIRVWRGGDITEGYWKDGYQHGRGRVIYYDGGYYIGEWKEGSRNGEGTMYKANGDIQYEGGWKDGNHYGQGTYYTKDGDKYTGIWDGYKGQGEVNYKDGKKYKGYWDWEDDGLKRHGLGTLYSADGQVLNQGKWDKDEYKGKE